MKPSLSRLRAPALVLGLLPSLAAQAYDYAAAAAYSDANNGHALVVAIDGVVTFEHYANGWSAPLGHRLASGTKSCTGVLMLMAVDDGLLTLGERIADTITEWQGDPRKSLVTYRQLLTLTSGILGGPTGTVPTYADSIDQATFADPGAQFDYGPFPFQIFGEALKRKLASRHETVGQYVTRKLITPLGMQVTNWVGLTQGEPTLPSGLMLTATEWLKFGEMVRNDGMGPNGRMVTAGLLDVGFVGTAANRLYGLGWWLEGPNSPGPKDTVAAKGAGEQRCYVMRSHRMTVIRFGESTTFSDDAFLAALMPAALTAYGNGCAGTTGVPVLGGFNGSRPMLGSNLDLRIAPMPANGFGVFLVGSSRTELSGLPLPYPLDVFGMTTCLLHTSGEVTYPYTSGPAGNGRLSFPVPNNRAIAALFLYTQAAVSDVGGNPAGLTWTNGLEVRFGVR